MGLRINKSMARGGRRPLRLELLESRLALDGGGLTLVDDAFDLRENGPQVELDVLANDDIPAEYPGAGLITSVSYGSEGGRIEIAPGGGSVLYTPPADFAGVETFAYAVDGQQTANVEVSLLAPLADDQYELPPDGQVVTLDVLANDPFWEGYDGARRITAVSVGSRGGVVEIAPNGKSIRYAAPLNGLLDETFTYVVDDLYPARVTVEMRHPLRGDEYEVVQHDPPRVLDVLENDPFWEGYEGERRITHVVDGSLGGEVEISADGQSLVYTAPTESSGYDTVTYVVDGVYEARASVRVYRPVWNDTFAVDENSVGFYYNVTANDTYRDVENVIHDVVNVVTSVTQPESGGAAEVSADGFGVLYTPAAGFTGTDTFTYTADGKYVATVYVGVTTPVRDDYFTVYQDTPEQLLTALENDFLGNGYPGARAITAVGPTENGGTVTVRDDGAAFLYTPAPGYVGTDRFTYTIDDELTATVSLTVKSLAQDDYKTIGDYYLGESFTYNVLANDHFDNGYTGPGLVTSVVLESGEGSFTYTANGLVTFTPSKSDAAVLRYTVDGQYEGLIRVSTVRQTRGDLLVAEQNSEGNAINVVENDFPVSKYYSYVGPGLLTGVTQSEHGGVVTIDSDAETVVYTPPEDFYGSDSFTYTVDGYWTETVTVEVVRLVRDDEFRVDSADGPQALPVLVNDLFGADYAGVGQITDVTATAAGATAAVSADGQSILYTPASGFAGTDSFTYTVDGRLKAEVSVVVDTPADDRVPTFDGVDDYFDFLLEDALERYSYLFGMTTWGDWGTGLPMLNPGGGGQGDSFSGTPTYSETNVQVAGVDEGDLVEFDAGHVYAVTDDGVTIFHAWPAEELSVASRVDVEGRPLVEFLYGDRLTVISENGGWYDYPIYLDGGFVGDWNFWSNPSYEPWETIVTVIDVSDREAPEIVQTTTMEGRYVDSRSVDGQVYTLLSNDDAVAPSPQIVDEDGDPTTPNRYETEEEYVARLTANRGEAIEAALPNYTTADGQGEPVRTGLLNTPETIHRPLTEDSDTLISIVSFDATSDAPGLTATSAVYSTGAGTIYASLDNFYVLNADTTREDGPVTRVAKFDWDPASGGIEFAASTTVPGRIVDQFSADESGDYFRIATTASNSRSGNWSGQSENMLFVLSEDDGVIESVGSIQNWALGESLRSVRFLGQRAFATTFQQVDPLFAIDLTDPASPLAVGHITLPGFTSYMHLVDQDHLLTVGRNTPTGTSGPTQVSLFDISDLAQPLRIAEYTFSYFSTSEAEVDHHAFGYFAEHGLLAMPVASRFVERVDLDGDGYKETSEWRQVDRLAVFHVDATANNPHKRLWLDAEIEHDAPVRRSGYIGDALYSVGGDAIKAVLVNHLDTVVAEAPLYAPPSEEVAIDPTPWTGLVSYELPTATALEDATVTERDEAIAAARAHLAERLGVAAGEPLLVTAESTPDAPGGGETIALRVGGATYWYRVGDRGRFEPAPAGYRFDAMSRAWNALASPVVAPPDAAPGDLNGDGVVNRDDQEAWRQSYGDWSLTAYLAADANADGVVDSADFTVWRDVITSHGDANQDAVVDQSDLAILGLHFGSGSATPTTGDFNGDGVVDLLDLDLLGAHYETPEAIAEARAETAPQPAHAALALLANADLEIAADSPEEESGDSELFVVDNALLLIPTSSNLVDEEAPSPEVELFDEAFADLEEDSAREAQPLGVSVR